LRRIESQTRGLEAGRVAQGGLKKNLSEKCGSKAQMGIPEWGERLFVNTTEWWTNTKSKQVREQKETS